MEGNISQLKAAIDEKLAPLKVAHTRLAQRSQRPNIELTRDPAQYQLVNEVKLIEASISVSIIIVTNPCLIQIFLCITHTFT